ncbi:hypothetical protein [Glycomyces tritici]|uniref:DNA-binding protein n=1 Tax=Glycomyces tritici TaxID=2665176 RepID=A0ABT7YNA2_9ACTN|nr:hypothetical protein [Glycomyces tritici]MDN3240117.1 hypothetical protein [Glycomyces tritici]
MTLRATQVFMTRFLREPEFREQCRAEGVARFQQELGLDDAEVAMIAAVDLDQYEHAATSVRDQRAGRTYTVFGALIDELRLYVDYDRLYLEYDRVYSAGWWQRFAETRRFETFATDFIVRNGLPEYLIDLARLCASITKVADTPKALPEGSTTDPAGLKAVAPTFRASLRRPFEVRVYRHDVLRLLDDPRYREGLAPKRTRVLIQRDWRQHKRSRLFPLDEEPLVAALAEGPASALELGERLPEWSYAQILAGLSDLYADKVVHLEVPAESVAEYTR